MNSRRVIPLIPLEQRSVEWIKPGLRLPDRDRQFSIMTQWPASVCQQLRHNRKLKSCRSRQVKHVNPALRSSLRSI